MTSARRSSSSPNGTKVPDFRQREKNVPSAPHVRAGIYGKAQHRFCESRRLRSHGKVIDGSTSQP